MDQLYKYLFACDFLLSYPEPPNFIGKSYKGISVVIKWPISKIFKLYKWLSYSDWEGFIDWFIW